MLYVRYFLLQFCEQDVLKSFRGQSHFPSVSYIHSGISHSTYMQSDAGTCEDKDNIQCISKWFFPWSTSTQINRNFDIRQDNTVILDDFQQWLSLAVPEATFTCNLYNSHWSCSGRSLIQMLFPAEMRTHLSFSEIPTVCFQEPCQLTYQY